MINWRNKLPLKYVDEPKENANGKDAERLKASRRNIN
jgi:hypothetical protein